MVTENEVIEALKTVNDPEIMLDVWTLGLVYKITIEHDVVTLTMTLTTPACPYGPQLLEEVSDKVKALPHVKEVKMDVVFDPPWQPSEELRAMLGV